MVGFLYDTNAVVALATDSAGIRALLPKTSVHYINVAVLAELYHGALKSARVNENLKRLEEVRANMTLVDLTEETAKIFGELKCYLQRRGRPIPINDLWIAASAVQHDLTVITRDRHFDELPQVRKLNWFVGS